MKGIKECSNHKEKLDPDCNECMRNLIEFAKKKNTKNTEAECKQPNWEQVVKLCSNKIQEKYPEYGNKWLDYLDNDFWNNRLQGEVYECKQVTGFLDHRKISELVDIINICAMQITNLERVQWKIAVIQEIKNE